MKNFEKIKVDIDDKLATIWLNQPEIHNALNPQLLKELTRCFEWLDDKNEIRAMTYLQPQNFVLKFCLFV